jgi:hypothetical protein
MSDKPIRDLPEDAKKKSDLKSEQLDEVVGENDAVGGVNLGVGLGGRLGETGTITHLTWHDDHTAENDT